jgi:hypothetical protein
MPGAAPSRKPSGELLVMKKPPHAASRMIMAGVATMPMDAGSGWTKVELKA